MHVTRIENFKKYMGLGFEEVLISEKWDNRLKRYHYSQLNVVTINGFSSQH